MRPTRDMTREVVALQTAEQNTHWIEMLKDIRDRLEADNKELEGALKGSQDAIQVYCDNYNAMLADRAALLAVARAMRKIDRDERTPGTFEEAYDQFRLIAHEAITALSESLRKEIEA